MVLNMGKEPKGKALNEVCKSSKELTRGPFHPKAVQLPIVQK